MFPNIMNPSPLYQGMFRVPTLPSHHSASFLMDNLLRDRQAFQAAAMAAGQGFNPLGISGSYPGYVPFPSDPSPRGVSPSPNDQNAALLARMFPGGVPQGGINDISLSQPSNSVSQRSSAFLNTHALKVRFTQNNTLSRVEQFLYIIFISAY